LVAGSVAVVDEVIKLVDAVGVSEVEFALLNAVVI
jgi:hypothetical protein